ncbi:MAG TPA: maleate cis-trans isomerase [Thermodesulfobacteriota bacterium]|nr:maleate cis-trans isomerase [Thermodesulfobacteriota bacterium]
MPPSQKRLGVIVPSNNVVLEPDLYRMAPPGISVHFARIWSGRDTPEEMAAMIDLLPRCCEDLASAGMDVYGFGCTGGSLMGGLGYDREIIRIMEEKTSRPATSTSTAVLEAFREFGVTRVGVVTPYEDWLNEKLKLFLKDNGIDVLALKPLPMRAGEPMNTIAPEIVCEYSREADRPEAQAIFISCTDLRASEVLGAIERDLGKPAIGSNQATLWAMLRLAKVKGPIKGFGMLLERL